MSKIKFILFFYLLSYSQANSQHIDTLHAVFEEVLSKNLDSAILINDAYYSKAKQIDSTEHYLVNAIDNYALAYLRHGEFIKGAEKAKSLILLHNNDLTEKGKSTIYNRIGICYVQKGDLDSTIYYFKKALEMRIALNDSVGIAASLNNIGMVSSEKSDFFSAITYLNQALRIREAINDSAGIASTTNNIGLIYYHQRRFEEAIPYYKRALKLNELFHNLEKEVLILTNIGNLFDEMLIFDSSLIYYEKAVKKSEESRDKRLLAISYGNIGFTYDRLNRYDLADSLYSIALNLRIEMEDISGLATIYNQMGGLELHRGNFLKSIHFFDKSVENAEIVEAKTILRDSYMGLSIAYDSVHNIKKSHEYLKLHLAMKDSVFNLETSEKIEEIQTKYETEKKEKQLAVQKIQIAEKEAKVQKRNFQLLSLGGGMFALLLIGGIVYTKQKAKQEKLKQQVALEQAEALNKVQNEKLRISRDLHDNIGSQLTFVISSLDNMNYIKDDEKRKEKLTQLGLFTKDTMNQLRETIWAIKSESITLEQLVVKVADFIDKAKIACPNINFKIEGSGGDFKFNSNQAINTYRVIQEAVNNAIKYSNASNIVFIVRKNEIVVSDDGIGFNLETTKASNGLINMKARMDEVGFKTNIISELGKGTKVSITLS